MKRATQGRQGLAILGIGLPEGQLFSNGDQLAARFFQEDVHEFGVSIGQTDEVDQIRTHLGRGLGNRRLHGRNVGRGQRIGRLRPFDGQFIRRRRRAGRHRG